MKSLPATALATAMLLINLCGAASLAQAPASAQDQAPASATAPQKVFLDTDIGDDIDDVYALGLLLSSPNVQIVGISSAWGDTVLRSRMIDRILCETGREDIPVATGISKTIPNAAAFSQKPWASKGIDRPHGDAVTLLLDQIRQNPGEVTLIAIGPLTNIGAAIDRDPTTFRELKGVVLMGGSVYRGYDEDHGFIAPPAPSAEYNITMDPTSAGKLFHSGVHIYMMPLDSTQVSFDETRRNILASVSTPLTDSMQVLTAEWTRATHRTTPTMFDAIAAAYAIDPTTCPTTPINIDVDAEGFTRVVRAAPNAEACLDPHPEEFFKLFLPRLLSQNLTGTHSCIAPAKPEPPKPAVTP
jgi:purine nucleosidase